MTLFQSFGSVKKARTDVASSSTSIESTTDGGDCSFTRSDGLGCNDDLSECEAAEDGELVDK